MVQTSLAQLGDHSKGQRAGQKIELVLMSKGVERDSVEGPELSQLTLNFKHMRYKVK